VMSLKTFKFYTQHGNGIAHFQILEDGTHVQILTIDYLSDNYVPWFDGIAYQLNTYTIIQKKDIFSIKSYTIDSDGWFSGQLFGKFNDGGILDEKRFLFNFKDGRYCSISKLWFVRDKSLYATINHNTLRQVAYYHNSKIKKQPLVIRSVVNRKKQIFKITEFYENGVLASFRIYTEFIHVKWGLQYDNKKFMSWSENGNLHWTRYKDKRGLITDREWNDDGSLASYTQKKFQKATHKTIIQHGIHKYRNRNSDVFMCDVYKNDKFKYSVKSQSGRFNFSFLKPRIRIY
jgi:hypothetical protein